MKKRLYLKVISIISTVALLLSSYAVASAAQINTSVVSKEINSNSLSSPDELSRYPSNYSSVELGFSTPVRKQQYNDCWANAGLATFESKLLHDGAEVSLLSVDFVNIWSTTRENGTGWQRTYNSDGYSEITTGCLTSWQGAVETSSLADKDIINDYNGDNLPIELSRYGVTAIEYLDGDRENIKKAIVENGGLYAAYAHSSICLSNDKLSYYMPEAFSRGYTGHAVEVVGWDDNYPRTNFRELYDSLPSENGAWLVKSSWGENFNEIGGYIWISYEDKYLFDEKYRPSYTIRDYQEITDNVRLEQNEIYGRTYEFDYIDKNIVTAINQFDFSNGFNSLDKVIFETECVGADYTIYYVPSVNQNPTADKAKWTKLYTGTVDYSGYICVDIEDYSLPVGYGGIAVELDTRSIDSNCKFGVSEWLTASGEFKFINNSAYNESYVFYNNTMSDLMDWYLGNNHDTMGGTFVIKAVTNKTDAEPTIIGDVDLNGTVNINDATMISRYLSELVKLTEVKKLNADVNGDGEIKVDDVTALQRMLTE